MRIRTLYRQLFTASVMMGIVVIALFAIALMFQQSQPLRAADYFDNYAGEQTFCRTINYYRDDEAKLQKLMDYADDNAMYYLMWRFGKERGGEMVRTCEKARHQYILERCEAAPELAVEQVVLEFNRSRVKDKGLI
ncbi:hypothetical protein [Ferrimonas marina]|uniref:Uncharacterized protein n=1 Tax=Ferrimonas marina TaxID=299255 RepID=A0A1M5YHA0_9GAMM|nr:hypothetical protein [Ferrimonas marina]SHI11259.1 hypothetical protein SAMN02745129_4234 [Ferrimonas marina]